MLLHKIIYLCTFLFVATIIADIQDSNPSARRNKEINYRLPNHTRPVLYDIKLHPHLALHNFTFDGEVLIYIEILSRTNILTLQSKELIIDESATTLKNKFGFNSYIPTTHVYNNLTEFLSLVFDELLSTGHYILHLKFTGILNDKPYGFYISSYTNEANNKGWFAGTNFMPTYARAAFPCWDEPALKATFKIAIKHHRNYSAISNMPIRKELNSHNSDREIWTYFEESPVISTYLVGFLVSDLSHITSSDGTINVWSRSNAISSASFAQDVAQKAAIELERYTNSSVRLSKIDHVALPGFSNKAMESWGLITYREITILHNEIISSTDALDRIAINIIHQTNHQWLGNVISPSWWTNIWINEGLAEYFKYYIADKLYKDWRLMELLIVRTLNLMLITDSFEYAQPLNFEPNTLNEIGLKLSSHNNRKASLLIRMLSHCLSKEVFRAGLIKYLDKHKYGVATPNDLWAALQDALNESIVPQNKFKIQEIMDSWTGQKGYPLVTVSKDQHTGRTKITQEYYQPYKNIFTIRKKKINTDSGNKKWWIPINFATQSNPNFLSTLTTHWLSPEANDLVLEGIDPQDWIVINIQHTGFYRVNYDIINWLKIADYLDSDNYINVHVLNRAQIINDAIYLMLSEKLDPGIFMELTRYLRRETDYIVWYPILEILNEATKFFAYNGGGDLLKQYALSMMNNIIETVSIHDQPNDDHFTKAARSAILHAACAYNHPICLHEAHAQLITYLKNKTTLKNRVPFHKKAWIFCNGIKEANETIWNKLLDMYTSNSEPTLYCLGYSKNLTIIDKLLNMTIMEDSPIAKKDIHRVFNSVLSGDFPNIDIVMEFTINHWNKLATILDDPTNLLNDIGWNVISRKQIQKINTFLDNLGLDVSQIIKIREHNIKLAEVIVNKIRTWLERRSSNFQS